MSAPILLLDIDGVCADFTDLVIRILAAEFNLHRTEDQVTQWDTLTALGVTDRAQRDLVNSLIRQQYACMNMKMYHGAAEGVLRLNQKFDIVPCTAPFPGSPFWHAEREKWVYDRLGIPSSKVIFCHEKYRIYGDYLVDDKVENLLSWQEHHPLGRAVLFERPWNVAHPDAHRILTRAKDWSGLVSYLLETER